MTKAWQQDIQQLLHNTTIASLATQGAQAPECSMAPYALFEGDVLLHLSALARHTNNIALSSQVGLMICTPETTQSSPLALPRISLQGTIKSVAKDDFQRAKAAYLKHIPDAEPLFSFADFSLYRISVESIHWVGGFGSARKISLESWRALVCQTS